ncbi:hypothetical protein Z949_41 [Sulfitobacter guttiformis KCTC 32187]|nr:hypothetical protein Z949_41 [Sulfitobacter guttiformis KCTC 32187]
MGNDLPDNIEDPDFNFDRAIRSGQTRDDFLEQIKQTVIARTAVGRSRGWKFPRVNAYLQDIIASVRNPHLVMVLRDPVPAGLRAARRIEHDEKHGPAVLKHLNNQLRLTSLNMAMIGALRVPTLIVSYEQAMRAPEAFLSEMAPFLGVELPSDLTPLLEFMTPGSYKAPPA